MAAFIRERPSFWTHLSVCLLRSVAEDRAQLESKLRQSEISIESASHANANGNANGNGTFPPLAAHAPSRGGGAKAVPHSPSAVFCERLLCRSWALRLLAVELHSTLREFFLYLQFASLPPSLPPSFPASLPPSFLPCLPPSLLLSLPHASGRSQ